MKKEIFSFKPGEWVILRKSYLEKMPEKYRAENEILNKYSYPHKIQTICRSKNQFKEILVFSRDERWVIIEEEFRLATEKEIKEQHIRNIFNKK
jgi:hypothetical protein